MPEQEFDVIVIGAGPVGENVADYAQQRGLSVAIVERELVGGECSYWACMPSKALLRPTEALAAARRIPATAAAITGEIDVDGVLRQRDAFAGRWDDTDQLEWLTRNDIELVRGHARLSAERKITVTTDDGPPSILAPNRAVVVATGSRSTIPPVEGLRDTSPWDNRDITATKEIPRRLLVLGGGAVGVEMAQAFQRLGTSEVTIVEAEGRLLPDEEPFVSEELGAAFNDEGIHVIVGHSLASITRQGTDGPVTGVLDDDRTITADEILVATGRRPATDDIGLDVVGLEPGQELTTDDHMRVEGVEGDWLYAVGDVTGRAKLTHQGKYHARLLGDHLAGIEVDEAWADHVLVPRVVFTDPQVAATGLTEADARDRGIDVRTVRHDPGHVSGGALVGKGYRGMAQLVIDQGRRVVVGATFVAPGSSEMLHAATIAIASEITMDRLWHAVPAFPTVSEVWLRLQENDRRLTLFG